MIVSFAAMLDGMGFRENQYLLTIKSSILSLELISDFSPFSKTFLLLAAMNVNQASDRPLKMSLKIKFFTA